MTQYCYALLKNNCNIEDKSNMPTKINEVYKALEKCETNKNHQNFFMQKIDILKGDFMENKYAPISPWSCCVYDEQKKRYTPPKWWKYYNDIKHHLLEKCKEKENVERYYEFANQKTTLYIMAGLYQLLVYTYYELHNNDKTKSTIKSPLCPHSKELFRVSGGIEECFNYICFI